MWGKDRVRGSAYIRSLYVIALDLMLSQNKYLSEKKSASQTVFGVGTSCRGCHRLPTSARRAEEHEGALRFATLPYAILS